MKKRIKKGKASKSAKAKRRSFPPLASVKVVGVGGGGGNIVSRICRDFVRGVDFIAINTDSQDLDQCDVPKKIYIGRNLTRGMGTGMNPDLGRQAVEENRSDIAEAIRGADVVFVTAGMGGGTGTGGAPVVAEIAKQSGALTVAVATKPFAFEGKERERVAQEGIVKLKDKVDALIVVPNERIFTVISKETPIMKAFEIVDDILRNALLGIVELVAMPGIINVDFADVRSIMENAGSALVGVGVASGTDRAVNAVNSALNSPLLEISAEGARGILLGIAGGRDMRMTEINEAAKVVSQIADSTARIIFGAYYDRNLKPNQMKVILIATGFNGVPTSSSLFGNRFLGGPLDESRSPFENAFKRNETNTKIQTKDLTKEKEASVFKTTDEDKSGRKKNEEQLELEKNKEDDVWDIPTFLRKKRK